MFFWDKDVLSGILFSYGAPCISSTNYRRSKCFSYQNACFEQTSTMMCHKTELSIGYFQVVPPPTPWDQSFLTKSGLPWINWICSFVLFHNSNSSEIHEEGWDSVKLCICYIYIYIYIYISITNAYNLLWKLLFSFMINIINNFSIQLFFDK